MRPRTIHFVYLHPQVRQEAWAQLHRFLHPGALQHSNQAMVVCAELDLSHHVFATVRSLAWDGARGAQIHLRYELIQSIQLVREIAGSIGFVDIGEARKKVEEEPSGE